MQPGRQTRGLGMPKIKMQNKSHVPTVLGQDAPVIHKIFRPKRATFIVARVETRNTNTFAKRLSPFQRRHPCARYSSRTKSCIYLLYLYYTSVVVGSPVNLGAVLVYRKEAERRRGGGLAVRRKPLGKAGERWLWGAGGARL